MILYNIIYYVYKQSTLTQRAGPSRRTNSFTMKLALVHLPLYSAFKSNKKYMSRVLEYLYQIITCLFKIRNKTEFG